MIADPEGLEHEVFAQLTSQYLEESTVKEIRGALERGDALALGSAAHKLKGSSAAIGAASVSSVADEPEQLAKSDDLGNSHALLKKLKHALGESEEAIRTRPAQRAGEP